MERFTLFEPAQALDLAVDRFVGREFFQKQGGWRLSNATSSIGTLVEEGYENTKKVFFRGLRRGRWECSDVFEDAGSMSAVVPMAVWASALAVDRNIMAFVFSEGRPWIVDCMTSHGWHELNMYSLEKGGGLYGGQKLVFLS